MRVVISSGHGKYIRGAAGPSPWGLDEVDEARRVVEQVATDLRGVGIEVTTFHDDTSHDQNTNLNTIVNFHNARGPHDLDVSVHFNAYEVTSKPMGTEVLYVSSAGEGVADDVVNAICDVVDFPNRGPKERTDLFFLNNTNEVAVLVETCFCDSHSDADVYRENFDLICGAIASAIAGEEVEAPPPGVEIPPPSGVGLRVIGKCSSFGGPNDAGVSPSEGLAFISSVEQKPELFLPYQPNGTTGLARRLNPNIHYVACRWDYDVTPREVLRAQFALVRSVASGYSMKAFPADWGPHEDTGRVADLSPGLLEDLRLTTDDEVEVIFPYEEIA